MTGTKTCPKPTFPVPGACGPNLRQIMEKRHAKSMQEVYRILGGPFEERPHLARFCRA